MAVLEEAKMNNLDPPVARKVYKLIQSLFSQIQFYSSQTSGETGRYRIERPRESKSCAILHSKP